MGSSSEITFGLVGPYRRNKKTKGRHADDPHGIWPAGLYAHTALYQTTTRRSMGGQCSHVAPVEKSLSRINPYSCYCPSWNFLAIYIPCWFTFQLVSC